MNGTIIEETTRHKHLGLTFSSTCTWTVHVNIISEKTKFLKGSQVQGQQEITREKIYILHTSPTWV